MATDTVWPGLAGWGKVKHRAVRAAVDLQVVGGCDIREGGGEKSSGEPHRSISISLRTSVTRVKRAAFTVTTSDVISYVLLLIF